MAITSVDDYIASSKQIIPYVKTATTTVVAANRCSSFDKAGNPGAGTLSAGNTANGVVPTDATAGYPVINAFGGSATGYLSRINFSGSVAGRLEVWDRLFSCGAHATTPTRTITLASVPSFSSRVPNSDYTGLRIFLEVTTTLASSATTVYVTYTNQAGTTGRTSGTTASLSGFVIGRWVELPLQAGDSGVQSIQTIVVGGTAAATGAFNINVMRPLWTGRVPAANFQDIHGLDKTGLPIVYADSALLVCMIPDSTSSGTVDCQLEIANL
jgi:hypothetical protein